MPSGAERQRQAEYAVEIFYDAEDGCHVAVVPDLPGCSAAGVSRVAAAREIEAAIAAWVSAAQAAGNAVPEPSIKQR